MPAYDSSNEDHVHIAALARQMAELAHEIVAADDYMRDPNRALTTRRTRLRKQLQETQAFQQLEQLCAAALGTTAFGEQPDNQENV